MTDDTAAPRSRLRRLGGWAQDISMASWLAVAVLVVTVTSLVVTSALSLAYGQDLADGLIDGQLQGRAAVKADEVDRYLGAIQARTAVLATSEGIIEASQRFNEAYAELDVLDEMTIAESGDLVDQYYREEFSPALEAALGTTVRSQTLVPVGGAATYLQRHYVVPAEDPEDRSHVDDAGDGSAWSEVHRELHSAALEVTARLGLSDLYFVDPASGAVVYSTAKGVDFATNLDVGPHGGSTLAAVMRMVREAPERGAVALVDMAPHVPDLGAPMLFMASPMYSADQLTGILIVKISVDPIDTIMTSDGNWVDEGFGETGETFLVAADGRMRSVARPFAESPEAFLADLAATGTAPEAERNAIAGVGTTAAFLKVADGRELATAVSSDSALIEVNNYLQSPVLRAVESIELDGLEWFVLAEVGRDEIDQPITDFRQAVFIAVAVFVITITFATVAWASGVFRPVRAISEKLRSIHEGEPIATTKATKRSPSEFTELAHSIDEMLGALQQRETDLAAAAAERLGTIRSLLPAAIAERVEAGDRNVIDRVPEAGIVVLGINGLGDMVLGRDVAEARALIDRLVEEIDSLAVHHGLERVKLVGDTYFAGCGLSQPYLDHVPRSVAFALDARDAVRELSLGLAVRPDVAAGIHSGPVTVGLAGSTRLVYDLWGESVGAAHFLARLARPGEILVSDTVRALLPPDIAVAVRGEEPKVWEIVGYRTAEDATS